jgi:hypothetical protein
VPLGVLQRLGFTCAETDDPYAAMLELCRRPLVYRALILSLQSLFREELALIASVKRRLPHVEVWLTQTDGRQALLADAMRLGADGLLGEDGLHRIGGHTIVQAPIAPRTEDRAPSIPPSPTKIDHPGQHSAHDLTDEPSIDEPVLSADELRALLQEQPSIPPSGQE